MRKQDLLASLLIAGSALLTGCQEEKPLETIVGKPLSVTGQKAGWYPGEIALVLEVEGKNVLAYHDGTADYLSAAAIVQSEIDDGDNETVELVGRYENYENANRFRIKSLKANGIYLKFWE